MRSADDPHPSVPDHPQRSRMRAFVRIVDGIVLGRGSAAAVRLDAGSVRAGYTPGLGLLLPEDPGTPAGGREQNP